MLTDFQYSHANRIFIFQGNCQLRVDLHYDQQEYFAIYENFSLSGEQDNYRFPLSLHKYIATYLVKHIESHVFRSHKVKR